MDGDATFAAALVAAPSGTSVQPLLVAAAVSAQPNATVIDAAQRLTLHAPAAVVHDGDGEVFAFRPSRSSAASVLVRAELLSDHPGVDGVLDLNPWSVSAAGASDAQRLMYGATVNTTDLVVVAMYAVMRAEPPIADRRGGTDVVAYGVGFGDYGFPWVAHAWDGNATCRFAEDGQQVAAVRINDANCSDAHCDALLCPAPPLPGPNPPACAGAPVQAALGLNLFGVSHAVLRRYDPPA
eukprot:gene38900-59302_t